jgi:CCR4-NOT transcriptional regulation complex NOT5 subunit
MEAFKHCERTTKTKAYSKEGLAAAAARGAEDKEKVNFVERTNREFELIFLFYFIF